MVFEVSGDPESSIVALRRLQWLRRSAVRRRFCRAWPLEAPLASRDAEAWETLDAETRFQDFGGKKRKKAGLKASLINNINNRDFEKFENFDFGKFSIFWKFWKKLDHHYLLLLITLPINDTLNFNFFYCY